MSVANKMRLTPLEMMLSVQSGQVKGLMMLFRRKNYRMSLIAGTMRGMGIGCRVFTGPALYILTLRLDTCYL